jgi:hypothetical protein
MYGLKPYITEELQMHNITTMDKAQHKEKIVKNNFKRSSQKKQNTRFLQGGIQPKAHILEIQGFLHFILKKRKSIVWKRNDNRREMQILWRQVVIVAQMQQSKVIQI